MKRPTSYWLLLLALLTSPALTQAQTTRFVSTTGTNANPATATSWATSTTNLQGAINASAAGDQVWVRSGLFRPTTTTGPNSRTRYGWHDRPGRKPALYQYPDRHGYLRVAEHYGDHQPQRRVLEQPYALVGGAVAAGGRLRLGQ